MKKNNIGKDTPKRQQERQYYITANTTLASTWGVVPNTAYYRTRNARRAKLAIELITQVRKTDLLKYELSHWTIHPVFDSPPGYDGYANYSTKQIGIVIPAFLAYAQQYGVRKMRVFLLGTILHEIAHAQLSPECGHGRRWKLRLRKLFLDLGASHVDFLLALSAGGECEAWAMRLLARIKRNKKKQSLTTI